MAKKMRMVHFTDRKKWRAWLRRNYASEKEVWLVHYRKATGKKSISYNDSVEEALCFGWIDSNRRTVDGRRYAQRFSPRRPNTPYSEANKERLRAMLKEGKVVRSVETTLGPEVLDAELIVPKDIIKALKAAGDAWRNFQTFPESYKRIRIGFIEGARDRPAEFERRLRHFVMMTRKNKMFGYGGIEKYYR